MAKSRNLGMGLELLLTAGQIKGTPGQPGTIDLVRETMNQALLEDEAGNICEAYYLYRKLLDYSESALFDKDAELAALLSQACNNAAIILYEQGRLEIARQFLQKSLAIQPHNSIAQMNLDLLSE